MPSEQLNNVVGALGGAVLAGCLVPQLCKLYTTRSARDLSYLFLCLYSIGLLLSFIYLFYQGAFTGWVCMLVELGFACTMIGAKFYLDRWYHPHAAKHAGRLQAAAQEGLETKAAQLGGGQSAASEVRLDVRDGTLDATFTPLPLHSCGLIPAARKLLLEVRLAPPASAGSSRRSDAAAASQGNAETMAAVAAMLEAALAACDARWQRQQPQALPSLPGGAAVEGGAAHEHPCSELCTSFFSCSDGYVAALLHPAAATLTLDFLAASDAVALRMAADAHRLGEALQAAFPGARVAAYAMTHLPAP